MLESGEARASKIIELGKDPADVMEYNEGAYFGELALMRNLPRAATVTATVRV